MNRLKIAQNPFHLLMVVLVILGIFFRFANLEGKVYWHDEVYTTFRAAGYTRAEIDDTLFQNKYLTPSDLQKFQQLKPDSTFKDTIRSLAVEDPQHPPLYFVIARFWLKAFGNSLTANRTLSVFLSLLSFPFIYLLAKELFASNTVAIISTALFAVSPFEILFDQTARQYGLLTTEIIASSWFLLKAIYTPKYWLVYSFTSALGFWTHPFFVLTIIGHGVYLLCLWLLKYNTFKTLFAYFLAVAGSLILYIPWIIVMAGNYERGLATTDWARVNVGLLELVKFWILGFTSIFVDFSFNSQLLTYGIRIIYISFIVFTLYTLWQQTKLPVSLFILTSILVPFLLLALPDLIMGGKRSTVTRYLLNSFPAVILAVAYFLGEIVLKQQRWWRPIFVGFFTITILSCSLNALADTSWSKDLSYFNLNVVRTVNSQPSRLLISDRGNGYTNMGDLLSMSYFFSDQVKLFLLSYPPDPQIVKQLTQTHPDAVIFFPTTALQQALEKQTQRPLDLFLPAGGLYQLK